MLSLAVLTYKMSQTTPNITKTCNKCTNFIKTIKATTQFVVFLFVHSWEQRKLGDIGKARSGVGFPDTEQGGVTGIPFFKVSDMNLGGNENEMTVANNYVTAEQIAVHRWSPITELPAIFFAKVGAAVMLNRKRLCRFPFLLDNNTMAYSLSSTKWDADFAKALFGTVDLTSLVQVGALPSYNTGDVESMEIYLPSLLEQEQIGGFFKQLDNLITLHQREFFRLILAFFCCNSTSILPISWEQRKLGDIGKARSGVGFPDTEQGGVTGIPFFKVSDMNLGGNENEMTVANNYVTAEQIAVHRWSPITELPAIFFAKVGAAVMLNRKRLCRFPFLLDNNTMAYSLSSTKWDADFAKALFGTVDLTSLVQVGALPSYNTGDVESMEIYLPSLLEQEQIGGFFKQLDNLITLHQCKDFSLKSVFEESKNFISALRKNASWEQRKLSDIAERFDNLRIPVAANLRIAGTTPYYGANGIQDYVDGYTHDGEFVLVAEDGANDLKNYPVQYVKGRIWVNNHAHVLQGKAKILDNKFLTYVINQTDIESLLVGCGRAKLNSETMMNIVLPIPAIKEQQIIGCCLSKLDNLIALHQRIKIFFTGDYHDKKNK